LQIHSLSDPPAKLSALNVRNGPIYKGTIATLTTILREEGITGLWKGNISAEVMYVGYGAAQFGTYTLVSRALEGLDDRIKHQAGDGDAGGTKKGKKGLESFIAGATAGGVATLSTYPFDLLRTRFAAQGNEKVYLSIFHSVRSIARDEGLRGFFRGSSAAVTQIVPYMGFFFACYETLHPLVLSLPFFRDPGDTASSSSSSSSDEETIPAVLKPFSTADALTGTMSSVLSKTLIFPLDTVRKRLQVQGPTRTRYVHGNIPEYRGVWRTMARTVKEHGLRGLYRGLSVSLLKAAPASAVTMWVYEGVIREMGEMELKKRAGEGSGTS
ncbi:mitochondrial thiamine pyrophosphate transporter, partial [Ascosphaera atra]